MSPRMLECVAMQAPFLLTNRSALRIKPSNFRRFLDSKISFPRCYFVRKYFQLFCRHKIVQHHPLLTLNTKRLFVCLNRLGARLVQLVLNRPSRLLHKTYTLLKLLQLSFELSLIFPPLFEQVLKISQSVLVLVQ